MSNINFRTPKVGERVVCVDLFVGIGRKGKRLEGHSDPLKKLVWVKYDDGETLGTPLKSLYVESEYKNSSVYKIMNGD